MGVKVRTQLTATFEGFKEPRTFEKDGRTIPVQGKLQFLVRDQESGALDVHEFTQKAWQAGGGPPYMDIENGTWFTITGTVDLGADRPWLRIENVEQAA
ncbi:MAG: hypothetical protein ACPGYP_01215 [Solirubrobacterales bacterium]